MQLSSYSAILALAVTLPVGVARSDEPFFSGTVIDALSGRPLVGVEITVDFPGGGGDTVWSGGSGRFVITEETFWNAVGVPKPASVAPGAGAEAAAAGAAYLADGRFAEDGSASASPAMRTAKAGAAKGSGPLPKATRVQGGPPFEFRLAGYEYREGRMRMLATAASFKNGDSEPDYELVVPMIPLNRYPGCRAP